MIPRIAAGVLFAALAALPAAAGGFTDVGGKPIDEYGFAIRGRAWMTEQDSAAKDSVSAQPGSLIEMDDDLDHDGDPFIPDIELEYRTGELAFHLHGWYASELDGQILGQDEAFDGKFFLAGERLDARFRVIQAAAHFEWIPIDLGSSKKIGLEIGIIAGVRWTKMEAILHGAESSSREDARVLGILPDFGITICIGFLNIFEIDAQISGMKLDFPTYDYQSINGSAELRIYVDDHFYFGGGYRLSSGSLERGDPDERGRLVEYEYHGPMVTIGVQF